jgi:hypothetical protein
MVREAADALSTKAPGDHSLLDSPGIMDPENPRSLINIAPKGVAELMREMNQDLLHKSERQLKMIVADDPMLNRLRIAFWKEYDAAQSQMRNMLWSNISRLMQARPVYFAAYFHRQEILAYILCPPASYDAFLEEALSHGMSRIREILDLPLRDEDGKVNPKVGELILKAAAFLDLRTHGGFLQKSVHAEVGIGLNSVKKLADELSLEEIDKKIKELESAGQAGAIDVTPEPK